MDRVGDGSSCPGIDDKSTGWRSKRYWARNMRVFDREEANPFPVPRIAGDWIIQSTSLSEAMRRRLDLIEGLCHAV